MSRRRPSVPQNSFVATKKTKKQLTYYFFFLVDPLHHGEPASERRRSTETTSAKENVRTSVTHFLSLHHDRLCAVSSVASHFTSKYSSTCLKQETTTLLSDGTLTTDTFTNRYSFVIPAWLLDRCHQLGWTHPTRIQQKALDALLLQETNDAMVQAETDSGKTLCYILPILAQIDPSRSAVQALVVVATWELGL
jgi:ATP-dependent helicase YprA (DUF1998 family)